MYVEVENDFVTLKLYDDGTFVVEPKKRYSTKFQNDLSAMKEGKISTEEFEKKYGIDELKKIAVDKYREILPEIKNAVEDFESFAKVIDALI